MQIEDAKNTNQPVDIILSVSEYLERLNLALGGEAGFVEGEIMGFKEKLKLCPPTPDCKKEFMVSEDVL